MYIKKGNYKNIFKIKSDPNIHQNAQFKKNLSGEHASEVPCVTSRKRNAYFTPILSPPMFEHGLTPLLLLNII